MATARRRECKLDWPERLRKGAPHAKKVHASLQIELFVDFQVWGASTRRYAKPNRA